MGAFDYGVFDNDSAMDASWEIQRTLVSRASKTNDPEEFLLYIWALNKFDVHSVVESRDADVLIEKFEQLFDDEYYKNWKRPQSRRKTVKAIFSKFKKITTYG